MLGLRKLAELKTWRLSEEAVKGRYVVLEMIGGKARAVSLEFNEEGRELVRALKEGRFGRVRPVVVWGGESSIFSAGVDLLEVLRQPSPRESRRVLTNLLQGFSDLTLDVLSLPVPTCAAINGHALAGGVVIACATDYLVGLQGSACRFGAVETQVGIPLPPFARLLLSRHLPASMRTDALLFGKAFSHVEAAQGGWIHKLARDRSSLLGEAAETALQLAPACHASYGKTKAEMSRPILEECAETNARVLEEAMDICFSEEGFAHLQDYVQKMVQKKA